MNDQGIIFLGYIKLIYFRGNSMLNHSSILSIIKRLCIYIILSIIFIFNESAYSAMIFQSGRNDIHTFLLNYTDKKIEKQNKYKKLGAIYIKDMVK